MKKKLLFFLILISLWIAFFLWHYWESFDIKESDISSEVLIKNILNSTVTITSKKKWNYLIENSFYEWRSETKEFFVDVWKWKWIFVSWSNYILTSKHVVDDKDAIYSISLREKFVWTVDKIWYHDTKDLALLKVNVLSGNDINLSELTFIADKINLELWDLLISSQKIGALLETGIDLDILFDLYLMDIPLVKWDSWGPVINFDWEIIAINTAISSLYKDKWFATYITQKEIDKFMNECLEK